MSEKRKKYDREFRDGAVRIVEETKKPIAVVARNLEVNEGTTPLLHRIRAGFSVGLTGFEPATP